MKQSVVLAAPKDANPAKMEGECKKAGEMCEFYFDVISSAILGDKSGGNIEAFPDCTALGTKELCGPACIFRDIGKRLPTPFCPGDVRGAKSNSTHGIDIISCTYFSTL